MRLRPKTDIGINNGKMFREIISTGFRQKRKTIFNNLKNSGENLTTFFENNGGLKKLLGEVQIDESRRAETLTIDEWKLLSNFLSK